MRKHIIIEGILLSLVLLVCLGGCQWTSELGLKEYIHTDFVMDTVLAEKIYAKSDYCKDLQKELKKLETESLSWRVDGSEIFMMNDSFEKRQSFHMSDDMTEWTGKSMRLAEDSKGAYDPTIGKLSRLWNIEGEHPKVPDRKAIADCLKQAGYEKVHIKENTIYIEETVCMDLGAAGKGIACDRAYDYLKNKKDVKGASISVGGSILVYGSKPDHTSWNIAIQNPEAEDGVYMGVLNIEETAFISTSGDYEKYFEQDGVRYHHILDPATGYPSTSDLSSVTIIADEGLITDALSTACYVLGIEGSKELLKEHNATAIFIDHNHKVTVMGPAKDSFKILDETFFMSE